MQPEWKYHKHSDGTEQWWIGGKGIPLYCIERVLRPDSRRKNWAIVSRTHSDAMYPPKIAGPFKDLDAAKVAYLMFRAALT